MIGERRVRERQEEERRGRSGGGLTMGKRKGWGKKIGEKEV